MAYAANWLRPDQTPKTVVRAFDNLKDDMNFAIILEWLRSAKRDCDGNSPLIESDVLYRQNQGVCQAINAIINTNDTAREKLNAPEPKKPVPFRNP